MNIVKDKIQPIRLLEMVRLSLKLLDKSTKRKYLFVSILQAVLSLLDLIGVALVGIIASLTLTGVKSEEPNEFINNILKIFKIESTSFQNQVVFFACVTVLLLVGKTILSVVISRRTLLFLSNRSAQITSGIIHNVLSQPLSRVFSRGAHELHYVLGPGVNGVTLGILGVFATMIADASLLIVMAIGLLTLSPTIAISSILFFSLIAAVLHLLLRNYAVKVGTEILSAEIHSNRLVTESLDLYRELYVRDARSIYASEISKFRTNSSRAQAEQTFLPNVSKYVVEISLIVGSVLIAGIQFLTQTADNALASLGLFLMAGSRIAPALMRLQQSVMNIQGRAANLRNTLEIIEFYKAFDKPESFQVVGVQNSEKFIPELSLKNIQFGFKERETFLSDICFDVKAGSTLAIVGPSGSGKTTLVNLILGLYTPTSGDVILSGVAPSYAVSMWPGAVAYVPQEVKLIRGTFRENIELNLNPVFQDEEKLASVIAKSRLDHLVLNMPYGIDTLVGESEFQLSGGQRQRLGLARAFYTDPKLIILDEATSALDSTTEEAVAQSLKELHGRATIIVIAHRLSTVMDADKVIYMNEGRVLATGTFSEVRAQVPDFDNQANLMGL